MPTIIITGTPIDFPNSAAAPNWAPAVIQFAELVAAALSEIVGTYDVIPQRFVIDTAPNGSDVPITNLSFSTTNVRGAFIQYSVYRNTSAITVSETGNLMIVYNPTNGTGEKWEITRDFVGDADVTFDIDDTGQININLTALAGTAHNGFISYTGRALQNSY